MPCWMRARVRVRPFAAAVRTKSCPAACNVALRTNRMSIAPSTMPIVKAGSSRDSIAFPGVDQPVRGKPCGGSHPSQTENTTMSIMPAHTTGTAASVWAPTLSAVPPRRFAQECGQDAEGHGEEHGDQPAT